MSDCPEPTRSFLTGRARQHLAVLSDGKTQLETRTANAFEEDRGACLSAGMDGFLAKPLDRERLADALAVSARSLAA